MPLFLALNFDARMVRLDLVICKAPFRRLYWHALLASRSMVFGSVVRTERVSLKSLLHSNWQVTL